MKIRSREIAPSTTERHAYELAHALTYFGDWFVDMIDAASIRDWRSEMLRTAAHASVNSRHRTLIQVLDDAVTDGATCGIRPP